VGGGAFYKACDILQLVVQGGKVLDMTVARCKKILSNSKFAFHFFASAITATQHYLLQAPPQPIPHASI